MVLIRYSNERLEVARGTSEGKYTVWHNHSVVLRSKVRLAVRHFTDRELAIRSKLAYLNTFASLPPSVHNEYVSESIKRAVIWITAHIYDVLHDRRPQS